MRIDIKRHGFIQVLPLILLAAFAVTTLVIANRVQQQQQVAETRSQAAGCNWGWCGGCVSTCHVSTDRCNALLATNCGRGGGGGGGGGGTYCSTGWGGTINHNCDLTKRTCEDLLREQAKTGVLPAECSGFGAGSCGNGLICSGNPLTYNNVTVTPCKDSSNHTVYCCPAGTTFSGNTCSGTGAGSNLADGIICIPASPVPGTPGNYCTYCLHQPKGPDPDSRWRCGGGGTAGSNLPDGKECILASGTAPAGSTPFCGQCLNPPKNPDASSSTGWKCGGGSVQGLSVTTTPTSCTPNPVLVNSTPSSCDNPLYSLSGDGAFGWCNAFGVRCQYKNGQTYRTADPWCDVNAPAGTPANTCAGPNTKGLSNMLCDGSGFLPPTNRVVPPPSSSLLTGGCGITSNTAMNDGAFEMEGYCAGKWRMTQDGNNWYCGGTPLTITDFDKICQKTYNLYQAFAIQSGTFSIPAFNWRCYAFIP